MIFTSGTHTVGRLTDTYTYFGRHHYIMSALERELKREKDWQNKEISCLIIGPGMDHTWYNSNNKLTRSYQPFELLNVLLSSGINNYTIEVIDNNPDVISELQKTPTTIKIPRDDRTLANKFRSYSYIPRDYIESFLKNSKFHVDKNESSIHIPASAMSRFNIHLVDIISEDLPVEKYDIVICTVLLSHYGPEYRHKFEQTQDYVPSVIKKIDESVKIGGYIIDTERAPFDSNKWQYIAFDRNKPDYESAGLFKKKYQTVKL